MYLPLDWIGAVARCQVDGGDHSPASDYGEQRQKEHQTQTAGQDGKLQKLVIRVLLDLVFLISVFSSLVMIAAF